MLKEKTSTDISAKPWKDSKPPKRILAIRLQAMGDMVISLPYIQYLRHTLPKDTIIDFLTLEEVMSIPKSIDLFNHVYKIGGGRRFKLQFLYTCFLLPKFMFKHYDMVLDLQNNLLSNMIRKATRPKAWCEFDRYSPNPAGERNRATIEAIGLGKIAANGHFSIKLKDNTEALLKENGWDGHSDLVILNPAGAFENRHWPAEYFIAFAKRWQEQFPSTQFLALGIDKIAAKAILFKDALGSSLVNLVNKTTPAQAFAIIQRTKFVLSEDSGMMHMAWVSGIPTLAIFGSTRSDWTQPLGKHTAFLDSSDMECGNCMLEVCRFSDERMNFCMLRYKPDFVFEKAMQLLKTLQSDYSE